MATLPTSLALTSIADGALMVAADERNNFTAVQTAVNALIAALGGGVTGQTLLALSSTAVGWAYQGGIYRKVTVKDVVNTTTETDLLNGEVTVGAGVMGTTGVVRATLLCDYLNNTGSTRNLTVSIKFGGTTLWGDLVSLGTSATRRPILIQFTIANQNSAAVQFMAGSLGYATATAGSVAGIGNLGGPGGGVFASAGTSALDTTTAKALAVTVIHSLNDVALSVRLQQALVEVV